MRISDWSSDVCSSDLGFDHASQRFERLGKPILLFAARSDFELAFSRVEYPQNHPAWAGQPSSCRCATTEERTRRARSAHRSGEDFACLLGRTDLASERLPELGRASCRANGETGV